MGVVLFILLVTLPIVVALVFRRLQALEGKLRELESALDRQQQHHEPREESQPAPQPISAIAQPRLESIAEPSVAPPSPPVQVAEPQVATPRKRVWRGRDLLRRIHLLPPESGHTTEVRLASWWATRIGILLGVISAVFFAAHVSQHATPLIRLVELTAVSGLLVGLGLWLERSVETFGRVVSAGGLAMLYVAAFAAHAFEPLKVTDSATLGLMLQGAGVAAMVAFSIWKRSEALGTTAILLGYVSCWFSHAYGLPPFTLIGLILFAAASAVLFAWQRWVAPLTVAFAGSYLGYILLAPFRWQVTGSPGLVILGGVLALLLLFHLSLQGVHRWRFAIPGRWRAAGILLNSAAAVVAGVTVFTLVEDQRLEWLFLAFSLVFALFALQEYGSERLEAIWVTLLLLSASFTVLFFFYRLEGTGEWLALAMLAGFLLLAWRYTGSGWVEGAFFAVWGVALCSFADDAASWLYGAWNWARPERFGGCALS